MIEVKLGEYGFCAGGKRIPPIALKFTKVTKKGTFTSTYEFNDKNIKWNKVE